MSCIMTTLNFSRDIAEEYSSAAPLRNLSYILQHCYITLRNCGRDLRSLQQTNLLIFCIILRFSMHQLGDYRISRFVVCLESLDTRLSFFLVTRLPINKGTRARYVYDCEIYLRLWRELFSPTAIISRARVHANRRVSRLRIVAENAR